MLALPSTAAASTPPQLRVLGVRSARSDFQPRDTKPPALKAGALTAAASGAPRELLENAFLNPSGRVANLAAGVTYKASTFPLPIRVTAPDASWAGAQWKYDSSFEHKKQTVAPYWGWVTFEQHGAKPHQGAITLMTAYDQTPSVASVVTALRTGGHGATYGPTSSVKVGGYSGVQFDGNVVGKEHAFIPFSPKTNTAAWRPDAYYMRKGEPFRIIVIGVHGKTVVMYEENLDLAADQFPTFLTAADTLLNTLRFTA
jgi:hypothetical protein